MKKMCFNGILMLLVFAVAVAFSGICDAAARFQADGGQNFVLDNNYKTSYGKYILTKENGSMVFSFDYDAYTQEFTMYREDGTVIGIRKMMGKDQMYARKMVIFICL